VSIVKNTNLNYFKRNCFKIRIRQNGRQPRYMKDLNLMKTFCHLRTLLRLHITFLLIHTDFGVLDEVTTDVTEVTKHFI
jgi:hypothetical protein